MIRVALLLALAFAGLQGDRPQLEAWVDQDRLSVGEDLTYTLRAVSHSPIPLQVTLAPFLGLEVISRTERTEVGFAAGPTRTTVLEVRLRAVRPGHWQIGPARAIQGADTVDADAVVVDVAPNRAAMTTALNPRLLRLLEHAPPPPNGEPAVDLLVSTDTARMVRSSSRMGVETIRCSRDETNQAITPEMNTKMASRPM